MKATKLKVQKSENSRNFFSILMLCLLISYACRVPEQEHNIIATVEHENLSLQEIISQMPPRMRGDVSTLDIREFVLRWINDEVLFQEALARDIDDDAELQKEFERIKKQLIISKLLEEIQSNRVAVTDEQIKAYYDANDEEFILSEDIVHAYHILLETRQDANEFRKMLKAGESFEEFAQDSADGRDWNLGYFSKNDVIPEISKVAFNIPVGSYSLPIKSEFGYHIIQIVDKMKEGEKEKLNMVEDEIRLKLQEQKKQENYQRFLLQTKSKYTIKTNFKLLEHAILDSIIQTGDGLN
ncbi:hypothetical protein GWO43_08745 [candidate division KSB1 bacterium]|nr:hypothetical protein [candidate division KSB1 bacterium]NIR72463.1 hypothetical protein [candidate division KSB1 bacterium]NIS24048.1 hypothetical protein [candidate division KSB1 bacterium]NIT70967.1 hypothetical protein [candidate division KSB1 bacterium]NIU27378.1 hypothetical protein [candidate division KSB1 bacterium]